MLSILIGISPYIVGGGKEILRLGRLRVGTPRSWMTAERDMTKGDLHDGVLVLAR